MEYIDVLDENGNKIGEIKPKNEVHEKGLWHRTAHVWLINSKNELLLQLRSKSKDAYPGCWDVSVAGHISAGEDSLTSSIRETEEEIGVILPKENFILIGTDAQSVILNNNTYFDNELHDVYIIRTDLKIEDFKFNDGEVEKVEYIPLEVFKQWVADKKSDVVARPKEYELLFNYLK